MDSNNLTGKTYITTAYHKFGSLDFVRSGAYCSLDQIATLFGKRVNNWTRLEGTKELFAAFREDPSYNGASPFVDRNLRDKETGKFVDGGGLYAHPVIAEKFKEWCEKPPKTESSCIYCVWAVGSTMFKIGIASRPFARVKQMQTGSPLQLIVSRAHRSDDAKFLEARMHEAFSKYRSHGEWFDVPHEIALPLFDANISRWEVAKIS